MFLLSLETELVSELASAVDSFERQNRFTERQERKAWNTVRKEISALSNFMAFLGTAGVDLSFHLGGSSRGCGPPSPSAWSRASCCGSASGATQSKRSTTIWT